MEEQTNIQNSLQNSFTEYYKNNHAKNDPTWPLDTGREGVAIVAIGAGADGVVIDHVTLGVDTTHASTRGDTL